MSAPRKKPAPKADRRPYKHAADMREALIEFHSVLEEVSGPGRPVFVPYGFLPGEKDAAVFDPGSLMNASWEMTAYAERLRAAARRVLVAKIGLKRARRYNGWTRASAASPRASPERPARRRAA